MGCPGLHCKGCGGHGGGGMILPVVAVVLVGQAILDAVVQILEVAVLLAAITAGTALVAASAAAVIIFRRNGGLWMVQSDATIRPAAGYHPASRRRPVPAPARRAVWPARSPGIATPVIHVITSAPERQRAR